MSEDDNPFPPMKRQDVISAAVFGAVALCVLAMWLLTYLPQFVQAKGADYVSAFAAISTAAAAFFTLIAGIVATVYVVLTYGLWKESSAQRESELMLRLLNGYDGLRDEVTFIRAYYHDCRLKGNSDPKKRFREAMGYQENFADNGDDMAIRLDDMRFPVSRFFVRTRKLVRAGFLSEAVVIAALDPDVVQEVFLDLVDPLDQVKAGEEYKVDDREFFEDLLKRYPQAIRERQR